MTSTNRSQTSNSSKTANFAQALNLKGAHIRGRQREAKALQLASKQKQHQADAEYKLEQAGLDAINKELCVKFGHELTKWYPFRRWLVGAKVDQGVLVFYDADMSMKYGYVIKLKDLPGADISRMARKAGGEFLERFSQSRGRRLQHQIDEVQRDKGGSAVPTLEK